MAGLIRFVDYSVVVYFFGQPCIVCLFLRRCFGITWKKRTQRHLLMSWYRPVSQGRNTEMCDGNNPKLACLGQFSEVQKSQTRLRKRVFRESLRDTENDRIMLANSVLSATS